MTRQIRRASKTDIYHVMMRGVNKEAIFDNSYKKNVAIKNLLNNVDHNLHKIYAYCIMDNHYHLVIKSRLDDLSKLMQIVNVSYAKFYNDNFERIGPVFNNRFKSECIESNEYLIAAVKYVHQNPVKAGITNCAKKYWWSSANAYANRKGDKLIMKDTVVDIHNLYIEDKKHYELCLNSNAYNFIDVKDIEGLAEGVKYINQLKVKSGYENIDKKSIIKEIILNTDLNYRQISKELNVSQSLISSVKKQL